MRCWCCATKIGGFVAALLSVRSSGSRVLALADRPVVPLLPPLCPWSVVVGCQIRVRWRRLCLLCRYLLPPIHLARVSVMVGRALRFLRPVWHPLHVTMQMVQQRVAPRASASEGKGAGCGGMLSDGRVVVQSARAPNASAHAMRVRRRCWTRVGGSDGRVRPGCIFTGLRLSLLSGA